MLTLAIETSATTGSVALLDDENCLVERTLELGQAHGQSLIPGIHQILSERNLSARDCGLIAVSIGPGSFTGLRVGIVCAKTWAYATKAPLVGVSTFAAIAENAPADVSSLQVISDAQRGDLFIGRFQRAAAGEWSSTSGIEILSAETWVSSLTPADTVAGPGLLKVIELIAGRARVLDQAQSVARAVSIGRLGYREAVAGRFSDPWTLEPLYLRRSSAEDKWDSRELKRKRDVPATHSGPIEN